jgi:hypothetical protein
MDRQGRTGDTVLVKSREMTDRTTAAVVGGRRGKDDRKQNTLVSLLVSVNNTGDKLVSGAN